MLRNTQGLSPRSSVLGVRPCLSTGADKRRSVRLSGPLKIALVISVQVWLSGSLGSLAEYKAGLSGQFGVLIWPHSLAVCLQVSGSNLIPQA